MRLGPGQVAFLAEARRAVLATIAPDGRPRLVPCCFALVSESGVTVIDTPIDDKPKSTSDPMRLARVQDVLREPRVSLLVDRWDEDWSRLGWLRIEGLARLLDPGPPAHASSVAALRDRYPRYRSHDLEHRPIIRITPTRVVDWHA